MNEEKSKPLKRGKGGRNPKIDPARFRYSVNFTAEEHARFLTLFEESGVQSKARFISARVFGEEFRVIKHDQTLLFLRAVSLRRGELQPSGKGVAQPFFGEESVGLAL